ncbi:hypothetical protein PInf_008596 [Phytophthora infestans]|nr:hypothetical protein PInf_008596 [Phytophthora infestans]
MSTRHSEYMEAIALDYRGDKRLLQAYRLRQISSGRTHSFVRVGSQAHYNAAKLHFERWNGQTSLKRPSLASTADNPSDNSSILARRIFDKLPCFGALATTLQDFSL